MRNIFVAILSIGLLTAPFLTSCKNKDKQTTTQEQKKDAPVVINSDDQLRTSVNSIVAGYPSVTAEIKDGVVTLKGNIKRNDLQNLMMRIQEQRPKKVENQLIIQ